MYPHNQNYSICICVLCILHAKTEYSSSVYYWSRLIPTRLGNMCKAEPTLAFKIRGDVNRNPMYLYHCAPILRTCDTASDSKFLYTAKNISYPIDHGPTQNSSNLFYTAKKVTFWPLLHRLDL